MISFGPTRKRKDVHNPLSTSRDKTKVRVMEQSTERLLNTSAKPHVRPSLPATRTFNTFRRGSLKIFSIFRNAKRLPHAWLTSLELIVDCLHRFRPKPRTSPIG